MEMRLHLLLFFLLVAPAASAEGVCPRPSTAAAILGPGDSFLTFDGSATGGDPIGAVEGDEVALLRALNIVRKNKGNYVSVLFYASWCPFSKLCRPNFNILSSLFPTIRHFAFEESLIKTSTLSRYGVHGFPTLFLINSTMRVHYHGSRTVNSLVAFYSDVTGVQPTSIDTVYVGRVPGPSDVSELKVDVELENCPFSWTKSPEKLLEQDTYLALASFFLVTRLLYFLLPRLSGCIKRVWRHMNGNLELAKQGLKRLNPSKRTNLQGGAINAKAWASKSLASVCISETGAGRTHATGERR